MSCRRDPVGEDDLMAYVDDRLSPERAVAVRAYLAMHPEEAERLSQYVEQRKALRAAFGVEAPQPMPTGLRSRHRG